MRLRLVVVFFVVLFGVALAPAARADVFGQIGGPISQFGDGEGDLSTRAVDVDVDPVDGDIYTADVTSGTGDDPRERFRLQRFDGENPGAFVYEEPGNINNDVLDFLVGHVAVDPGVGRRYVYVVRATTTGSASRVQQFELDAAGIQESPTSIGNASAEIFKSNLSECEASADCLRDPFALAVDAADGSLYLGGYDDDGDAVVVKTDGTGGELLRFGKGQLNNATGVSAIDVGPGGDVFVLDRVPGASADEGRVQEWTSAGVKQATLIESAVLGAAPGGGVRFHSSNNADIAVDGAGKIHLSHGFRNTYGDGTGGAADGHGIVQVDVDGDELLRWGLPSRTAQNCTFGSPPRIALNSANGEVVALDVQIASGLGGGQTSRRVLRFGAGGSDCGITAGSPPTASFTFAPAAPKKGQQVSFDGSASSDPDGTVAEYQWDLDGDPDTGTDGFEEVGTDAAPTFTYATAGQRTVRLRVKDDDGNLSPVFELAVNVTSQPPDAALSVSPNPAQTGQVVTFDASASTDIDGTIVKVDWDVDGTVGYETTDNGPNPALSITRTYAQARTYQVRVRVTDSDGDTDTANATLTVNGPPPPLPSVATPSAQELSFGEVPTGSIGPAITLTITNTGESPLEVTSATTEGIARDDFLKTTDTCSQAVVQASAVCELRLRFAPSALGSRTANVRIKANIPNDLVITLTGTGGAQLVGPQGPTGPQGPAGQTGAGGAAGQAGPTGPQGPAGQTGAGGAPGQAGPTGPAGQTGASGSPGPQGERGPAGPQGRQGRDALVTCTSKRSRRTIKVTCRVTYKSSAAQLVRLTLFRSGRIWARGSTHRSGRVTLRPTRNRLRAGQYRLRIIRTDGRGVARGQTITIRLT